MTKPSAASETISATTTASSATRSAKRRYNRMILIGTPEWVKGMILRLHSVGVAEVNTWSRPMPTQKSGIGQSDEVISILQWRSTAQQNRLHPQEIKESSETKE